MNVCSKCGREFDDNRLTCPACGGGPVKSSSGYAEDVFDEKFNNVATYGEFQDLPFYYRTWFIIVAFLVFWPAGIVLFIMRNNQNFHSVNISAKAKKSNKIPGAVKKILGAFSVFVGLTSVADMFPIHDFTDAFATSIIAGGFIGLGIWLFFGGNGNSIARKRMAKYEALIDNRGNTKIAFIAEQLGEEERKVTVQLQKMINNGFLKDPENGIAAYINGKYNILVMTKNGVPMVPVEETVAAEIKAEEKQKAAAAEKRRREEATTIEAQSIIAIEDAITKVQDEEVVLYLKKMATSINNISEIIKGESEFEKSKNIVNMRESYLPATLEMLEKIQSSTTSEESKNQIKGMFSTLSQAFANIEKQLTKRDEVDMEVDMDVLKQILAREGLLDSDFNIKGH